MSSLGHLAYAHSASVPTPRSSSDGESVYGTCAGWPRRTQPNTSRARSSRLRVRMTDCRRSSPAGQARRPSSLTSYGVTDQARGRSAPPACSESPSHETSALYARGRPPRTVRSSRAISSRCAFRHTGASDRRRSRLGGDRRRKPARFSNSASADMRTAGRVRPNLNRSLGHDVEESEITS